jgi:hypothetical protein
MAIELRLVLSATYVKISRPLAPLGGSRAKKFPQPNLQYDNFELEIRRRNA